MLLSLLELIVFLILVLFFITQVIIPLSQATELFPIFRGKKDSSGKFNSP